jgi:fibronectin type 3 domain-containing protein
VTVTNTGNSNVQISQITASGTGYSLSGAGVPITLTPSQKLTFSVIFGPTVTGTVSGSVTITSNATGSPSTITLSGSGVVAVTHSVGLSWTASTSTVNGYNVYRSTTSGAGYTKLNGGLVSLVNYTDSTVANGTTYYYVTTAVDGSGLESINSNEASAVIP